jgi:ornithine cyclodeaminase/alanine dehydrogenase-like protein (mu-crystallin family)
MSNPPSCPLRLLSRRDVEQLLTLRECIDALERAFLHRANGGRVKSAVSGLHADGGGFHAKGALMLGDGARCAIKINANFPGNPARGLPTIQGVLALFDAECGVPLAVMDSSALTIIRTAAASGVAAKFLARADASSVAIAGCGAQAAAQLEAICRVRRIACAFAFDTDAAAASRFAVTMSSRLGIPIASVASLPDATLTSDIIVTCTTSRDPFLTPAMVRPGAFVAAVGADNEHKSEIAPALMKNASVVCDDVAQCAQIGDLHHAIAAGAVTANDVRGDIDAVVARRVARRSDDEIIVFDSTGVPIEDVAAASLVYERATSAGLGQTFEL